MAQSTVPAQGPTLPDVENGIGEETDALHSGSAPQQPPLQSSAPQQPPLQSSAPQQPPLQSSASQQSRLQRSPSQQLLLKKFDGEVYPPVEAELAWYDERELELGIKYREKLEAREARAARQENNREPVPLDVKDYDEYCFTEIKNLVLIERSLIHRKALEEWDRKEKLFTSRVERKSKKVGNLKNEVYQLIGFFSVFQGVVLTAVAQSSLLHCNNLWSPIVLSVLASVVTIAGVAQKLSHIWSFQKTISSEQSALKVAVSRGQALREAGKAFVFMQVGKIEKEPKKQHSRWYTAPYTVVVLIFLLLFTFAFPLSHWRILCHHGPSPYDQSPGA